MPDCKFCTSATNCTECNTLYLATSTFSQFSPFTSCVACPPSSQLALPIVDSDLKKCLNCAYVVEDPNCVTCSSANICLTCSKGYFLKTGNTKICFPCTSEDPNATACIQRVGGVEILECSASYAIFNGMVRGNHCARCQAPLNHRFDLKGTGAHGKKIVKREKIEGNKFMASDEHSQWFYKVSWKYSSSCLFSPFEVFEAMVFKSVQ